MAKQKKKKVKAKVKSRSANPEISKFLHSFRATNQKVESRNFRATRIHQPRRPK